MGNDELTIFSKSVDLPLEQFPNGVTVLINKPKDWTSFDVVNKIRGTLKYALDIKKIKVGHAGTLDPLATGLLIVCIGKHTKKINQFQELGKVYTGTIEFGKETPSYDMETEVSETYDIKELTKEKIKASVASFLGWIDQKPPIYSAIKKNGVPLYKLARKGETTEIKTRKVEVQKFETSNFRLPLVDFTIACSKGTYIRSLAHDLGKSLDNGGVLVDLHRTSIGDFKIENAWELDEFITKIKSINMSKKYSEPDTLTGVAKFHTTFHLPILDTPQIPSKERCALRISLIQEELDELKEAIENNDVVEAADAFADIQYVLSGAILEFGMAGKFKAMFDEAQRSNMSKACDTEEDAIATQEHYKKTQNVESVREQKGADWLVYRIPDRKVLKSVNYSPADFKSIVES